jgi:class 3 adenylate cyclase/predicted ATPase
VRCAACESDNPSGQKFCGQCGTSLATSCPSCGAASPPGQRFCGDCGSSLTVAARAPAPAAVRTERRVCSVLFCDLVGFTPLSEARDPEEVRELLSRYFDATRTVIARYGGVIEKFIGDAVMAVWGTPVATEGDAERAVRAALEVVATVAQLGAELGVPGLVARAGVVTGEVAVNIDAVGEGMVAGDPVNTAARVQGAARPGTVLVDEATLRLARSAVAFGSAGEHVLRGKAAPVELWTAERIVGYVGGEQRVDGLESPLVGRDAELRLIKELFHASVDRSSPRLVSITGQAGVGKSRLGWEFEKYIDGVATVVNWHRGRCLGYGGGVAFGALAEMVRQRLGIAEDDPPGTAAQRLAERLNELVPDDATREFVAPRLGRLLGLGGEAAMDQSDLFAGWRLFFEQLAAVDPVVMLVEDLHHADDGLLDFLTLLLDWSRASPIFILTFARSELTDRRPSWGSGRGSTTLVLEPLDDAAMTAMLDGLVPDLPPGAAAAIARQAEGVPLYAVETVRMLVDRDVIRPIDGVYRLVGDIGELRVPDSLHSLLSARLDSLAPLARQLVADAAVLGSTFPAEALVQLSGRSAAEVRAVLDDLVRREVFTVRADPLSPERGQFAFVQTLLRQVAYDTLSRRERKARHLAVAEHLSSMVGGEEVADVVAGHLVDALEAVPGDPDVPELRSRAAASLTRAGERAARTGAPRSAAGNYHRAAEVLEATGTEAAQLAAAELYERAGWQQGVTGERSEAARQYRAAEALYQRLGQDRRAVIAAVGARRVVHVRAVSQDEAAEAQAELLAAIDVLSPEPDAALVVALSTFAYNEVFLGRPQIAEDYYRRALALAYGLGLDDRVADLLSSDGLAMIRCGRIIEGIALLRESLRRAQASGDVLIAGRIATNLSDVLLTRDGEEAVEAARTAVTLLRQVGARDNLAIGYSNLVSALLLTADWDGADEVLAVAEADDCLDTFVHFNAMSIALARGDHAELARRFALAEPDSAASADVQDAAALAAGRAMLAFGRGEYALCLQHSADAIGSEPLTNGEIARWSWPVGTAAALALRDLERVDARIAALEALPVGARGTALDVELALARSARADLAGAPDPALDALAVERARATGYAYALARALTLQAEHLVAAGESDLAADAALEARALAARLRLTPIRERLDRLETGTRETRAVVGG